MSVFRNLLMSGDKVFWLIKDGVLKNDAAINKLNEYGVTISITYEDGYVKIVAPQWSDLEIYNTVNLSNYTKMIIEIEGYGTLGGNISINLLNDGSSNIAQEYRSTTMPKSTFEKSISGVSTTRIVYVANTGTTSSQAGVKIYNLWLE